MVLRLKSVFGRPWFRNCTEVGNDVANDEVVGAGIAGGAVDFAFDLGHGLKQKLAQVSESVGSSVRDAFVGEGVEDLAQDVVYVDSGDVLAGDGGELCGQVVGFADLLLFLGVEGAQRRVISFAKHAAAAAVGDLAKAAVVFWFG